LIAGAGEILKPGGVLAVEIADSQRDAAIELANAAATFESIEVLKDHEGLWRVLVANRS
jgi:methylase of polypeptide subunit release factors